MSAGKHLHILDGLVSSYQSEMLELLLSYSFSRSLSLY